MLYEWQDMRKNMLKLALSCLFLLSGCVSVKAPEKNLNGCYKMDATANITCVHSRKDKTVIRRCTLEEYEYKCYSRDIYQ